MTDDNNEKNDSRAVEEGNAEPSEQAKDKTPPPSNGSKFPFCLTFLVLLFLAWAISITVLYSKERQAYKSTPSETSSSTVSTTGGSTSSTSTSNDDTCLRSDVKSLPTEKILLGTAQNALNIGKSL